MVLTLYGIKNCDTMKKARGWLEGQGLTYAFHDYKVAGIDEAHLQDWVKAVGWTVLLNKAGTTFKALSEADKADIDEARAIRLMLSNPSMIKRPVLDKDGTITVGFKPEVYAALFA